MSSNNNNNNNQEPSTIQSYLNSASETIQSMVGGGEKSNAPKESTTKVPGGTLSSSGAFAQDDSRRTEGSWNQTIGSAKEAIGGLVGSESLKQQGRQQNLEGQQEEAKGQLGDFGSGLGQRAQGSVGGAVAAVTGDKKGEAHYREMHDEGKTLQRGAEHDMAKQANRQD